MRLRARRQARYERLRFTRVRNVGIVPLFMPFEARALSKVQATDSIYWRTMVAQRKAMLQQFIKTNGNRFRPWRYVQAVKNIYQVKDWVVTEKTATRKKQIGRADPWAMMRKFRDDAIELGAYHPKPSKGSHRRLRVGPDGSVIRIDKGKIKAQAARWRAKQRPGSSSWTGA